MRHEDKEPARRRNVPSSEKPVRVRPVILHPYAIFTLERARQALELGRHSLKREIGEGRLRPSPGRSGVGW
jgi:hypothetical protein